MPQRITLRELRSRLRDPNLDERSLRPYVRVDERHSGAFRPLLVPNWEYVDPDGLEADVALGIFNALSRSGRQRRYRSRLQSDPQARRVVSEGDSWFQYPILLDDVIDQLFGRYAIYSLGGAGDLLADMVEEDEITAALESEQAGVLLVSGGGNDLVHDGRLALMLQPFASQLEPEDYPNSRFDDFLKEIRGHYRSLVTRVHAAFPGVRIFCHGYDRAIPDGGRWLGRPLERLGIRDRPLQRAIVGVLIDRFNEELDALQRDMSGVLFHVDCRGAVADGEWHDELHPTDAGYAAVAARFRHAIDAVTATSEAHATDAARRRARPETLGSVAARSDTHPEILTGAGRRWVERRNAREESHERLTSGGVVAAESAQRVQSRFERLSRAFERESEAHQRLAQIARERPIPSLIETVALERVIGKPDFQAIGFLENALAVARFVGRIRVQDHGRAVVGFGTGFMVSPRLLLTNHHVLEAPEDAASSHVDFDFQNDRFGQPLGMKSFALEPETFFVSNPKLDFTLVAVSEVADDGVTSLAGFAWTRLIGEQGKALLGDPLNVIQHPQGQMKQIVLRSNELVDLFDRFAHYVADTEPGSSGSPVFNDQFEVVALHHSGVPRVEDGNVLTKNGDVWQPGMDPALIDWVANEGIRVSRLIDFIREVDLPAPMRALRADLLDLEPPSPMEVAARAHDCAEGVQHARPAGAPDVSWSNGEVAVSLPVEVRIRVAGPVSR